VNLSGGTLGPIDRVTLRERVLETLRHAILDGGLVPGTRLTEVKLSEELGVSRGTVREAVLRLAQEHLVVITARQGAEVRRLSSQELLDIYAVRAELEGLAARLASQRPRDVTERVLRERLVRMGDSKAGSFLEQVAADLAFHQAICELSGNEWLLETWRLLSGPIRGALVSAGPDLVQPRQTLAHHTRVVDAILAGNAEEAVSILVTHLRQSAQLQSTGMRLREAFGR
jgi:DNA-binding GntR family transcriptional regulator